MAFLNFILGYYYLEIKGLNIERLLMRLRDLKIYISDIQRPEFNRIRVKTDLFSAAKLLEETNKLCYNIEVKRISGLTGIYFYFKKHLGLTIGILAMGICLFICSLFVFDVRILGTNRLRQDEVISFLKSRSAGVGSLKSGINTKELEIALSGRFDDISLVSINIHGGNLIVNIKERLPDEQDKKYQPVFAKYDGVITSFTLLSGTSCVNVGDIVKAGDVLVLPYILDSEGKTKAVAATAQIMADVTFSSTVVFEGSQEDYLKQKTVLETQSKNDAKTKLPQGTEVLSEQILTNLVDGIYYITTDLNTNLRIDNEG